jgi:integration host factor subunit alpha
MTSKTKGGLTKADLVDVVYDRHGALTKDEAADIVDAILGIVKTNLGNGRAVRIKNFGVFEVAERAGRMGVNPASGEKMFIPPHKGLSFRPAARLKRQVSKPKSAAKATAEVARRAAERLGERSDSEK